MDFVRFDLFVLTVHGFAVRGWAAGFFHKRATEFPRKWTADFSRKWTVHADFSHKWTAHAERLGLGFD